jgi:hypothetical protein
LKDSVLILGLSTTKKKTIKRSLNKGKKKLRPKQKVMLLKVMNLKKRKSL